jgi:hypothetical protein
LQYRRYRRAFCLVNIPDIGYIAGMAKAGEPIFPVKKLVRLTAELAERIKTFRHEQRIDSENEAIRRLLELGLKSAGESKPPRQQ